jgi:hypothetical protein
MPITKEQNSFLQSFLTHEQWEHFISLGDDATFPNASDEAYKLIQSITDICKDHNVYSICNGWGVKAVYTRLSFLKYGTDKWLCIDNLIKISMTGPNIGQITIMVEPVIYKDVYDRLKKIINEYNIRDNQDLSLSNIKKHIFLDILTSLNNLKDELFINNKLIYNKIFSTDYYKLRQGSKLQYLVSINDL